MNCKPGDLAVVIRSRTTPEVIGKIVTVVRVAATMEKHDGLVFVSRGYSVCWMCSAPNGIPLRTRKGRLLFPKQRAIPDSCLRPIRPLSELEGKTDHQPIKETA